MKTRITEENFKIHTTYLRASLISYNFNNCVLKIHKSIFNNSKFVEHKLVFEHEIRFIEDLQMLLQLFDLIIEKYEPKI